MADFVPNPRYRHFNQDMFTAGDYEQFVSTISNKRRCMGPCTIKNECPFEFETHGRWTWEKYRFHQDPFATFEYIFHKFKKGIYVQIVENDIQVFLPFSNVDYHNEYVSSLKIDVGKHGSFEQMYEKICTYEGRPYVPNKVCWYPELWYCNNGLVRYEYPLKENDSGIHMMYDMIKTLCKKRRVPDCEFFLNKRDFPILSMHGHEPYTALVPDETPLFSYDLDGYLPILSMCTKSDHADIPIPTWEDWSRASYLHDQRTFPKLHKTYPTTFCMDWNQKKRTIVFRGASTGLGTTVDTNPRFYFAKLCKEKNRYWEGTKEPYLDIGIAKWNTRPRKHTPSAFLDIPNIDVLDIPLLDVVSPYDQSTYRYILHLPGHSCAYRLSLELGMGSVIFMYPSEYYLWYTHLLRPYEHYIPLTKGMDEEEIFTLLEWCESHPDECRQIATNARVFYDRFLGYDAILDTLQGTFVRLAEHVHFERFRFRDLSSTFRAKEASIISRERTLGGDRESPVRLGEEERFRILRQTKRTTIYHDPESNCVMKASEDGDLQHAHAVSCLLRRHILDSGLCQQFLCSLEYNTECNMLVMPYHEEDGLPLDQYLMNPSLFRMNQFKGILTQIALALEIAQRRLMFVHYDLTPWNVMLYRASSSTRQVFVHANRSIHVQGCRYIPKIIDFEYASVVDEDDDVLIHRMKPFFLSDRHDLVTLVYNSFHILLKHQRLEKDEIEWVRDMMLVLSGQQFHSIQDLKHFLSHERKFSRLLLRHEKQSLDPKRLPSVPSFSRMRRNGSGPNLVRRSSMDRLSQTFPPSSFIETFVTRIGYYGVTSSSVPQTTMYGSYQVSSPSSCDVTEDGWLTVFDEMYNFIHRLDEKQKSFDDVCETDRQEWTRHQVSWKECGRALVYDWSFVAPPLPAFDAQTFDMASYRWFTHVREDVKDMRVPIYRWVCRAYRLWFLYEKGYLSPQVYEPVREWVTKYERHWVSYVYRDLAQSN